jgi:hypothetical protein
MNIHAAVQNWVDNDGVFGEGIAFLHGIGKSDVYARLAGYMLGHFVPESAKQELRHTLVVWTKEHTMSENTSEVLEISSTKKATVTDSQKGCTSSTPILIANYIQPIATKTGYRWQ